jgi:hypothetical protein
MNLLRPLLVTGACLLLLAGCRVSEHKNGNGDSNVEVGTPFGSMHVKTNDKGSVAGLGITPYPGASPYKDDKDNTDAADVNMSFGDFHLGVRAASFKTSDSQDQIVSFYKKDLQRYGDVLECRGDAPVGEPTHTAQGLTCNDDDKKVNIHPDIQIHTELELRAGSPEHEHIVALSEKGGGMKIALIALDLPEHHDSSDSE